VPILGVCLGHQCIGHSFGGEVVRNQRIMHGKVSPIYHDSKGLFAGLSNPFDATRYHSLVIAPESMPGGLVVNAVSDDGEIMGVRHTSHPVHGVQFHPESVLTRHGYRMLARFLFPDRPVAALPASADGGSAGLPPAEEPIPTWYHG
jgi:anthranilate synthase component 2